MSFLFFLILSCIVFCSCLCVEFMDSNLISPHRELEKCCDCDCGSCSLSLPSGIGVHSSKHMNDEIEGSWFSVSAGLGQQSVARVESENENLMLREMVNKQQQTVQDLISDLEEERNASSSAANEAMSMILRLQREKAEAQMEARQFKRMVEERMGHDQQEMSALQELLYKREQVIQSLTCEVQAYKHRMMSFGLIEEEADGEFNLDQRTNEEYFDPEYEVQAYEYPPLRCNPNDNPPGPVEDEETDGFDIEKYPFGETPRGQGQLKNLEYRIHHTERTSSYGQLDDPLSARTIPEKIIVSQSPRRTRHFRRYSTDSYSSFAGMSRDPYFDVPTDSPKTIGSWKKMDCVSHVETPSKLRTVYNASEEEDDMSDRIYSVDYIPTTVRTSRSWNSVYDNFTTPRESSSAQANLVDPDIKKLYARLHVLEADRESMRHEILSMQTDKTQLLLLKEIAECLCKSNASSAERILPAKKPSNWRRFSVIYVFKWIGSSIFWWRKPHQCKYTLGMSPHHVGLLILLDMSLRKKRLRCLTKVQVRG